MTQGEEALFSTLQGYKARHALELALEQKDLKLQPIQEPAVPQPDEALRLNSLALHREEEQLIAELQVSDAILQSLLHTNQVYLFIKYRNQPYHSDPLEIVTVHQGVRSLTLNLALPTSFTKVFHREYFRVPLPVSLMLQARVHLGTKSAQGRVADISAGGCRIELSPQDALRLMRERQERLTCELIFPSQQRFQTQMEIRYLQPDSAFAKAQLGGHFQHVDLDQEKQFARIALETEREVARMAGGRGMAVAPSTLFRANREEEFLNPKVAPAGQGKKNHLFTPGFRGRLEKIADQLGCQALLLSADKGFDSHQIQNSACQMIELIEQDEDGVFVAVDHAFPGIHPVLLHTLRVTARCYPLALQMGISQRLQLPMMAALLLHDLGKVFVSLQPCFNPTKQPGRVMRELKMAQIDVLRSTSSLQWIPRSLGEPLLANANERLDGSGYPRGLKADRLDPLARLVTLCKVLDCLTRFYDKKAMTWQDAYTWVERHAHQFDTQLLKRFKECYGLYPAGSRITFESGHIAWVTATSREGEITEVALVGHQSDSVEVVYGQRKSADELAALGQVQSELLAV